MYKKIRVMVLFWLIFCVSYAFGDIEQARTSIVSLIEQGNYAEAQAQTQQLLTDVAGDEKIAETIWQIAAKYKQMQEYDKAYELNQYNVENNPDKIEAMWSQTEIIEHHIREKSESAFNNLVTVFAAQPSLPKEVWRVASIYDGFGEYDKALDVNKYNIEHFPNDIHAMWSQVGTIYYYLRNQDDDGFDREFEKLHTTFAGQETLSREIWNVAGKCDELEEYDKALEVNRYNIEHFHGRIEAMWSQVGTIYYYLRNQDYDGFDREFEKLCTAFAEQESLPKEIWFIACRCDEVEEYDKALDVNRYNIEHFPDREEAMRSQVGTIYYYLRNGDYDGFYREFETLYTVFAEQPALSEEIFNVAKECDRQNNFEPDNITIGLFEKVTGEFGETSIGADGQFGMDIIALREELEVNDVNVTEVLNEFIEDHNDNPQLYPRLFGILDGYASRRSIEQQHNPYKDDARRKIIEIGEVIVNNAPDDFSKAETWYLMGDSWLYFDEYSEAIKCYEAVAEKYPDERLAADAQYLVGNCYESLLRHGQIEREEGLALIKDAYQKVIDKYPDSRASSGVKSRLASVDRRFEMLFSLEGEK